MRGKRVLPPHIRGTIRSWKTQKRRELFALQKAAEVVRSGCAYTPLMGSIDTLTDWIKAARATCSEKQWGR